MRARIPFLNWRPDAEEVGNDGLVTADNVIHEPEGWKPAHLKTTTSFATTGALASITSIVAKPFGVGNQVLAAWINDSKLNVGLDGVTATWATTGFPVSFASAGSNRAVTVFDVAQLENYVFCTQAMAQDASGGGNGTVGSLGYYQVDL